MTNESCRQQHSYNSSRPEFTSASACFCQRSQRDAKLLIHSLPSPIFVLELTAALALAAMGVFQPISVRASGAELDNRLRAYLQADWPASVTSVRVGPRLITIEGCVRTETTNLYLAEIPPFVEPLSSGHFASLTPFNTDGNGDFAIAVKRREALAGEWRDSLFSSWAVVRGQGPGAQWLSAARYADTVATRWELPEEIPRGKKGLSPFSANAIEKKDLDELGISSVTVNIGLDQLMHVSRGPGRKAFVFEGRTWFTDNAYVSKLDSILRETARRRIVASAIILTAPAGRFPQSRYARLLAYPGATPAGIYVMPNITSRDGVMAFAAALDFLCHRYCRPYGRHGRIDNWILGNEVDSGWIWTNAGAQPALCYMDLYYRVLRVMDLLTRQYNSHARVLISLDHFCSENPEPHCYPGRPLLEDLLKFSKSEGDFDWGIAFHPYPKDLFNPKAWIDVSATTNLNTRLITFKNIEVLVRWAEQPRARFDGKVVRAIHLTEQGFNSRTYSTKSLEEQAAGLAYAWHKIEHLDYIEEMDYHSWTDNRDEGGLRLGLRKFADDSMDPAGRKPIWYLYRALGTHNEDRAMDFALPVIGVTNWRQAP